MRHMASDRPTLLGLAALLLLLAGIAITAYGYYRQQVETISTNKEYELAAIASLKVNQIDNWLHERQADAQVISADATLAGQVRTWIENGSLPANYQEIQDWMGTLQTAYSYRNILLLKPDGSLLISQVETPNALTPEASELARQAAASGQVQFSNLYRDLLSQTIRLDMAAPLKDNRGIAGVMLLEVDPYSLLYPLIQAWPAPSKSAETLLVRRQGDQVLYLNELRHQKNTALELSFPISSTLLPAARAVRGETGVYPGMDYRGAKVLAASQAVTGTDWYIIAKVDQDEIYAPVYESGRSTALMTGALLLSALLGGVLVWREQRSRAYRRLYESEVQRLALAQRYQALARYANDIILLADGEGQIVEANERAVQAYGYSQVELCQMALRQLCPPEQSAQTDALLKRAGTAGIVFETQHQRKDGSTFPVEVSGRELLVAGKEYLQSYVRDISERKRAEQALYQSQVKLRAFFEAPLIGILFGNVHGDILDANDEFLRIVGYTRQDLQTGRLRWIDLTPPEYLLLDEQSIAEARQTGVCTPYEKQYICKDGQRVWVLVGYVLQGEARQDSVAYILDISARKQAEAQVSRNAIVSHTLAEFSHALVKASLEVQAVLDAAVHHAGAALDGYCLVRLQAEGSQWPPPGAVYHPDERLQAELAAWMAAISPKDDRLPSSISMTSAQTFLVKQTSPEALLASGHPELQKLAGIAPLYGFLSAPLRSQGAAMGVLFVGRPQSGCPFTDEDAELLQDMADRVGLAVTSARLYEQVQRHSHDLEERVLLRTAQLETAVKELEAFSYSVSHDLRAPLRAIDGFSRILLEDYTAQLDATAQRYLSLVRTNTQQMGNLIDDLLAFSRLSRQPIVKQKVEPAEVVRQVLNEVENDLQNRAVAVTIEEMPACQADPALLKLVYVNLVSNALKFTRQQEKAAITAGYLPVEALPAGAPPEAQLASGAYFVSDNGVGFDMRFVSKLFNVFQRLHRAEDYEGTGVGLANVARIIHRHGGQVWAVGQVGRGAIFYFTLP